MRERKPVSLAQTVDPTLLWYSRAVGNMRQRPFTDSTSWRFQSAVHGYDAASDPYTSPTDPPPSAGVQKEYWKQCQHGSWFFLSWHRMYLSIFEQIVADAVERAGGPKDWALPYWDYSASDEARSLPWAFRQKNWPDGEVNHLYLDERAPGINQGTPVPKTSTDITTALSKLVFSASPSRDSFGGGEVQNFTHFGRVTGALENVPHNQLHNDVGGPSGFMSDPDLAALDPIFWCHHSNIDRLWEVWIRQPNRLNPTSSVWLTGVRFPFLDANKQPVVYTSSQVTDTRKLGYGYVGMGPIPARTNEAVAAVRAREHLRAELLGASAPGAVLAGALQHIAVPMLAENHKIRSERVATGAGRLLLNLEDITTDGLGASFDVFVNLPDNADDAARDKHLAGRIALFGKTTDDGHGRSFVLDITSLHDLLEKAGALGGTGVKVSLKRVHDWGPQAQVGRVSVVAE